MRWDHVIEAVANVMAEDSILKGIYGDAIRKQGVHNFVVPSLDYLVVLTTISELWEPTILQFNQWTSSLGDLTRSDRRIRQLFNHDNVMVIGGVVMFAQFEDGGDLTGPETEGYYGIASRYRFTPVREKLLLGRSS